jgi:hypothetical protein
MQDLSQNLATQLMQDLSQNLATQLMQDLSQNLATQLPSDLAFGIFRKNLVIHLPSCQLYPKYKRQLKAK